MKNFLGTFLLLIATLIWGTAFIPQTTAMNLIGPFTFTAVRLILGGVVIIPFLFFVKKKQLNIQNILLLSFMGLSLWLGSIFQQLALIYTKIANVAFLTALYVPFVAIILFIFFKTITSIKIMYAITFCLVGTWFLIGNQPELGYFGDLLAILGAIFWSMHIILISIASKRKIDPFLIATFHIIFAGILGLVFAFIFENPKISELNDVLFELIYTGVFSIGLGFTLQTFAQRYAPSSHIAIVLSMESVFAAVAAFLILGQLLKISSIIGSIFIIIGVLISQFINLKNGKNTRKI